MIRSWTQRQQAKFGGDAHDRRAEIAERVLFWGAVAGAVALALAWASPASALSCLTKAQALKKIESPGYRVVDGQRCWYVVDYVPDKAEFAQPKRRKEVVSHVSRQRPGPDKATPAVARAPVVVQPPQASEPAWEPSAEWYVADRSQAIEALCGTPCRVGSTSAARVQDAFEGLLALIAFDRRSATSWRAALVGP